MTGAPKGLRVPPALEAEIQKEMRRKAVSWSAMIVELIDEAIRMRRAPGIVFVEGPTGKRAVVAGTGLDVWEVVAMWKELGEDYTRLRGAYDWVPEPQLRAALSYYELYPAEIEARLEREAGWTAERLQREFPFTAPRS